MPIEIPSGWAKVSLGDLLQLIRNGTTAVQDDEPTPYPVTRIETISEGVIDRSRVKYLAKPEPTYLLSPGDILYSHINSLAHMGKVALYNDSAPLYHGMNLMLLRPRSDIIEPNFLFAVLASEPGRAHARREAKSAINQASLGQGDIKALIVLLPPLPEQRRIADILDTVDAAIQQTEALIAKLKLMKAGLLHDLLTRGLDEQGHLRDPDAHPEQFKDSPLGRIPREWEIIFVSQAGEVRLGRQRAPQYQSGQFSTPYLRVANVFDGWIDYTDVLQMDFSPIERTIYGLLPGDILLNEGQSLELVGRSAIYQGAPDTFCFQNTLIRFRCNQLIIPHYCQAVFKYWLDTRRFTQVAKQTTSVAHLGASRFANMPFPLPSLAEQQAIATMLDAHDARLRAEEAYGDKLKQLKQGLMHDLLTGRVRAQAPGE